MFQYYKLNFILFTIYSFIHSFVFETGFHYIAHLFLSETAQAALELTIFLPSPPKIWEWYKCVNGSTN
jgi:hypothetical protein